MDSPQFVVSDSDVGWRINVLSYALCFLQTDSGFEVLASLAEVARELLKVISWVGGTRDCSVICEDEVLHAFPEIQL